MVSQVVYNGDEIQTQTGLPKPYQVFISLFQ